MKHISFYFQVKNVDWLPQNALRMHHFDANFSKLSGEDPRTPTCGRGSPPPPPSPFRRYAPQWSLRLHWSLVPPPPAVGVLDPPLTDHQHTFSSDVELITMKHASWGNISRFGVYESEKFTDTIKLKSHTKDKFKEPSKWLISAIGILVSVKWSANNQSFSNSTHLSNPVNLSYKAFSQLQ